MSANILLAIFCSYLNALLRLGFFATSHSYYHCIYCYRAEITYDWIVIEREAGRQSERGASSGGVPNQFGKPLSAGRRL